MSLDVFYVDDDRDSGEGAIHEDVAVRNVSLNLIDICIVAA